MGQRGSWIWILDELWIQEFRPWEIKPEAEIKAWSQPRPWDSGLGQQQQGGSSWVTWVWNWSSILNTNLTSRNRCERADIFQGMRARRSVQLWGRHGLRRRKSPTWCNFVIWRVMSSIFAPVSPHPLPTIGLKLAIRDSSFWVPKSAPTLKRIVNKYVSSRAE